MTTGRPGRALLDAALAAAVVLVDVTLFSPLSQRPDQFGWAGRPAAWLTVTAALAAIPVLALRRRAPVATCLVLVAHAAVVTSLLGYRPLVTLLVALHATAVWSSRGRATACLVAVLGAHALAVAYEASFPGSGAGAVVALATVFALLDVATWSAGRWGASAASRARLRQAEEDRLRLAERAVHVERLRIARELHDIVAHAVTTMVLQAGGARALVTADPERARAALSTVGELGAQAVDELRRMLTLLRETSDHEVDAGAPSPASRLSRLPELAGSFRATGMDVGLETLGVAVGLDPSVELAAYRLVQEALTNVAKHAGPGCRVQIRLSWTRDALTITVSDDGADHPRLEPAVGGSGFGLVGLEERIRLAGGTFAAAPVPGSGFTVRAELPTRAPVIGTGQSS